MKAQIEGLNTTLTVLDGFQSIQLLEFLVSFKEAFDSFRKSDVVAVRALTLFVSDEARECNTSHKSPGVAHGNKLVTSWPQIIHALLQRFVTDDVLQTAYDAVTREVQETN